MLKCNIFVPTFFPYELFKYGHLHKLLSNVSNTAYVSHSNITELLRQTFGIENATWIQIPGHQTFMPSENSHYPDIFPQVIENIKNLKLRPQLALVAAGYLGKAYCECFRLNGTSAIDIGSLFDAWTGLGREAAVNYTDFRLSPSK